MTVEFCMTSLKKCERERERKMVRKRNEQIQTQPNRTHYQTED